MNAKKRYMLQVSQHWQTTKAILYLLNQETELQRLMGWAGHKRQKTRAVKFSRIQASYKNQCQRVVNRQLHLRLYHPQHYKVARCLHLISELLSKQPRYYQLDF